MKSQNVSSTAKSLKKKRIKDVDSGITPLKSINNINAFTTSKILIESSPNPLRSPSGIFSPVVRSPKAKRSRIDINVTRSPITISPNRSFIPLNTFNVHPGSPRNSKDALLEGIFGSPSSILSATSKLTRDQKQAAFEQWLKAATANKINSKNSWNLPLIDCLSDMTLLKDKNDDINFQKASCTLDGCVKIYASRVESVILDTGKLLSGLSTNLNNENSFASTYDKADDDVDGPYNLLENDSNFNSHPLANDKSTGRIKKKLGKTTDTLAKNFDSINLKSFDVDSSLDPLFKKMSAEFDEGGYKGLLINRLSINPEGSFLLDPNCTPFCKKNISQKDTFWATEDSSITQMLDFFTHSIQFNFESPPIFCPSFLNFQEDYLNSTHVDPPDYTEIVVDIFDRLNSDESTLIIEPDCINVNESSQSTAINCSEIMDVSIQKPENNECPTMFQYQSSINQKIEDILHPLDQDIAYPLTLTDEPNFPEPGSEYDVNEFRLTSSYDNEQDEDENPQILNNSTEDTLCSMIQNSFKRLSISVPHVTSSNIQDDKAVGNIKLEVSNSRSALFAYFDSVVHKNWAGPIHWKLHTSIKPVSSVSNTISLKKIRQKTTQQLSLIDFCNVPEIDIKRLFEKPTSQNAINLSSELLLSDKNRTRNMLPEDLGISSKDLFSLFCKPNLFLIKDTTSSSSSLGCDLVLIDHINAAASVLLSNPDNKLIVEKGLSIITKTEDVGILSNIASQQEDDLVFEPFEDDLPLSDFIKHEDGIETNLSSESIFSQPFSQLSIDDTNQPSLSITPWPTIGSPKFLRVDPISYCKIAKRVNMQRLKASMWTSLSSKILSAEDGITLSSLISSLDVNSIGGQKKSSEVSFPYCFISLLHLANEHDLLLSLTSTHTDITISNSCSC